MLGNGTRRRVVHTQMACWTLAERSVPFGSSKNRRFLERRAKCGGFRVATTTCGGQDAARGVRRAFGRASRTEVRRSVSVRFPDHASRPRPLRPGFAGGGTPSIARRPTGSLDRTTPEPGRGDGIRRVRPSTWNRPDHDRDDTVRRVGRDRGWSDQSGSTGRRQAASPRTDSESSEYQESSHLWPNPFGVLGMTPNP